MAVVVTMTKQRASQRLVSDQTWELLEPVIPCFHRRGTGGADRHGVRTGPPWRASRPWLRTATTRTEQPTELGFGSGTTSWHRLWAWQEAGVWDTLHHLAQRSQSIMSTG